MFHSPVMVVVQADRIGLVFDSIIKDTSIHHGIDPLARSPPVDAAQRLQKKSLAKQIRISKTVYDAINDEILRDEFEKSGDSYVATSLTFPKLEELNEAKEEKAAVRGTLGVSASGSGLTIITNSVAPIRPYAPED